MGSSGTSPLRAETEITLREGDRADAMAYRCWMYPSSCRLRNGFSIIERW